MFVPQRDQWMKNYYARLASGAFANSKLYWSTMEPFQCDTERMRQTYYAYVPARMRDFDKIVMN